jgi:VWFA-related protein
MMMKMKSLMLIPLLLVSALWAQEQTFKLNVNVDLTEVHVNVTDEKDHPIGNLNKDNFRIFEDRTEQKITLFKHEDLPISLGLVIDNSRSMEPRKVRMDQATLSFVRKSNSQDETFIIHFDDSARLDRDFTDSIPLLEDSLAAVKPYGQTAIYDALILGLEHMDAAKNMKRAILLFTDGVDNSSKHTLSDALEATRRAHVAVYPVGLLSMSGGQKAEESLIRIAEVSGGRAFFPATVEEARTDMERVARDLREQYTLGYFPSNPSHNGAWRSIRIDVLPPPGLPPSAKLNANYRHGYYGPGDGN